ncbi:MAG TPA: MBL fold metallo-hydrolase [archaeon]|nr:MBL fold metallo-hydrolase [archaeon]
MGMKVKFLGAAQEVGRSSFLVDYGDKVLLDHGVKLHVEETSYPLEFNVNLDAVILSHAHLDHSGNIPHLYYNSNAINYMTSPTQEISHIMWKDTIKIANYDNVTPIYDKEQIDDALNNSFTVDYKKKIQISDSTSFEFFDAGHICGAALTKLQMKNKTLLYSGDFKMHESRVHKGADFKSVGKVDYLMIEATYGDRNQEDRIEVEKRFIESAQETVDNGGIALIPAFAVGRTQEIIQTLVDYKFSGNIYMDGMGKRVTQVFLRNPRYLRDQKALKKAMNKVKWIKDDRDRKKALKEGGAIVSTAGMLQGGPVYYYLPLIINDKKNKIILTGYQVEDTPGRTLMETGKLILEEEVFDVNCPYERFDFSAHADHDELFKAIELVNPEKVVLVHGDPKVMAKFAAEIKEKGFTPVIPQLGHTVEL